ncbi:hypothetical protein GDO86_000035 [Hymenochirus boettgeri]|uniref:N-acetyltransferase domain-containing protein n=1 Tax=Hymenochirus boettgeri TaxID=247094 RepID=A0A8T2K7Q9_9PIPI|nr:hypothetical protein GDO86_000035 [Hymenochirus boettgeri]
MATITIRRYRNSDHDAVCLLFSEGNMEHVTAAYFYILRVPRVYIPLLLLFGCMLMVTNSYLLSVLGLSALVAVGWWSLNSRYHQYVSSRLKGDLYDIDDSYMEKTNCCFWVAEIDGGVVGTVAVRPAEDSDDEMILKRLCVAKSQRKKGIGKALCMKVIDYARERGYKAVSLETDVIQYDAQTLYERMGFNKYTVQIRPNLFGKCTTFSSFWYRYEIKS